MAHFKFFQWCHLLDEESHNVVVKGVRGEVKTETLEISKSSEELQLQRQLWFYAMAFCSPECNVAWRRFLVSTSAQVDFLEAIPKEAFHFHKSPNQLVVFQPVHFAKKGPIHLYFTYLISSSSTDIEALRRSFFRHGERCRMASKRFFLNPFCLFTVANGNFHHRLQISSS